MTSFIADSFNFTVLIKLNVESFFAEKLWGVYTFSAKKKEQCFLNLLINDAIISE